VFALIRVTILCSFLFAQTDPTFNLPDFLNELQEVMIPEVIGAFRLGDKKLLLEVTEGDARRALMGYFQARELVGVESDPRILDVRGLDVVKAEIGENDVPHIQVSFVGQHVAAERSTKKENLGEITNPLQEHDIVNVYYAWTLRRDYTSPLYNWKIVQFQFQAIKALV